MTIILESYLLSKMLMLCQFKTYYLQAHTSLLLTDLFVPIISHLRAAAVAVFQTQCTSRTPTDSVKAHKTYFQGSNTDKSKYP